MNKPIIGLIGRLQKQERYQIFINEEIRNAIIKSGGIPILILPPYECSFEQHNSFIWDISEQEKQNLFPILDFCDGFVFSGGEVWYGYEEYILEYAYRENKPVLGICLGMQMMSLLPFFHESHSDLLNHISTSFPHYQKEGLAHSVAIFESKLKQIIQKDDILVTSRHHDCIQKHPCFLVSAVALDGTIEAIEFSDKNFFIGVQWHPESSFDYDENSRLIFQAFIKVCLTYSKSYRLDYNPQDK